MSQEYLYEDAKKKDLGHPDSSIRLACVVHRFKVPRMGSSKGGSVSFNRSFRTVGNADKTRKLMLNADDGRDRLYEACKAKKVSAERVIGDAKRYQPMIHTVLLSCKVQPEQARLDEKLVFEWKSGIEGPENADVSYTSEAIMYDLVMTVVCEGLGRAAAATENSIAGEFGAASRDYAAAAGVFGFLAEIQLPKWVARGSKVDDKTLPAECHVPCAKALNQLFMANGQQMAIATVLVKPGTPNYSLLAKLCLGVSEQLEEFIGMMRREAFEQMSRMDPDFFTLIAFQTAVQKSLSLYFSGRAEWDRQEYGMAIALLSEATVALRTRDTSTAVGVPDIRTTAALKPLEKDLKDLRSHMASLLHSWEKDNNSVYFQGVPQRIPAGKKLQEGLRMNKAEKYDLEEVEPVLLVLPDDAERGLTRTDSDLARELQNRLNAGEEF